MNFYSILCCMQTLVRPRGRVLDYRTSLTGISASDLEAGCMSRKEACRALRKLIVPGSTVLVGHSLYHDLASLKLDYQPVIDTSFVFSYE